MLKRLSYRRPIFVRIMLLGIVAVAMFLNGFMLDVAIGTYSRLLNSGWGGSEENYFGPMSLEERIVHAEVIARVDFRSARQAIETHHHYDPWGAFTGSSHVVAMEFTFDVLEYLKGNGSDEVHAVVDESGWFYETALGAALFGRNLVSDRDDRWDDREAIVFLRVRDDTPSSKQPGRYWLGSVSGGGHNRYTIANRRYQPWLPDAASPADETGELGQSVAASAAEQQFLLEEPPDTVEGETGSATDSQTASATISLSALKSRIAATESEIADAIRTGSTEFTPEEYEECIRLKYQREREVRYTMDLYGEYDSFTTDIALASGGPVGTQVYSAPFVRVGGGETGEYRAKDWFDGKDKQLFVSHRGTVSITRPLHTGSFEFYFAVVGFPASLCDAIPEEAKRREELVITVTAPDGVLHEAFFDPVAIGDAVGADATNGQLKPVEFDVEGGGTRSISSIEWEDGEVTMVLSLSSPSVGYDLDFIDLDGDVTLRLLGSEATVSGGIITWDVATQPWNDGDLLMLRMRPAARPVSTP